MLFLLIEQCNSHCLLVKMSFKFSHHLIIYIFLVDKMLIIHFS